jgi:hypothetical protein
MNTVIVAVRLLLDTKLVDFGSRVDTEIGLIFASGSPI